jgi:ATP sulfurylase
MPILFQLPESDGGSYAVGETLALTSSGTIQALLRVEDCFSYELEALSQKWFGTSDREHAGVGRLFLGSNRFISGKVELLSDSLPERQAYDLTPAQARYIFEHRHWQKVVGFHTRNVPHRAHEYLHMTALTANNGDGIFIHPVIGPKRAGDFSGAIILESYQLLIDQVYTPSQALLGGFATYARYAGPREAVFTAICRQNFGCTHFIVGRDHTGVGNFYHPDASKRLFDEIGDISIQPVFFDEVYYCQACETHVERCQHGRESSQSISGTWARTLLSEGKTPPEWYMRGEISALIQEALRNGNEVFSN